MSSASASSWSSSGRSPHRNATSSPRSAPSSTATEILSSDRCRGLVSDDENSQEATTDAFDVLRFIAAKRLAAGRLTVIDATNVQPEARKPLVALAREFHCLPVALVLNLPEKTCQARNRGRPDRDFGNHVMGYTWLSRSAGPKDSVANVDQFILHGSFAEIWAAVVPAAGSWTRGDRWWTSTPAASASPGSICVTAGTPGTWKAMANLAP